jgi:phosphoglycerate dehydrogenase-like enzyme
MRALILAPFSQTCIERLRARIDVVHESWLETQKLWDPAELGARVTTERFDVLVIEADFAFEELFEAARGLRLLGVCRNALNQVDVAAATARGVAITHTAGRNTRAVVELTLGLMLSLARRIPAAHTFVSGGGWREPAGGYRRFRGREVAGSTVGVIGFGQIGREVARACTGMGARVVAHDPAISPEQMREHAVQSVSLDQLVAESDFTSLHVPELPATRRLVNTRFLGATKPGALLINTSGGSVVDTDALVAALESGRLAGAALDVFDGHPLPQSSALMAAPNLILTPHIGGATRETIERQSSMMSAEIERLLDGKPLQHVVNAGYALAVTNG